MTNSYQNIKNITEKWCNDLLDEGIYDDKSYEKCLASFVDLGSGELPPEFETAKSDNVHSFSLHGRKENHTLKKMGESDTIILSTENGYYLSSNVDGVVSLVKEESLGKMERDSIEWKPQNIKDHQYAIKSVRSSLYLGADTNGKIEATREAPSSQSIWYLKRHGDNSTLTSVLFTDKKLTAEGTGLVLSSGHRTQQNWKLENLNDTATRIGKTYDASQITNEKQDLLKSMVKNLKTIDNTAIEIDILKRLINDVSKKYDYANRLVNRNTININDDFSNAVRLIKTSAGICVKKEEYLDEKDCTKEGSDKCMRNMETQMGIKDGKRFLGKCIDTAEKKKGSGGWLGLVGIDSPVYKICKRKTKCLETVGENEKDRDFLNKYGKEGDLGEISLKGYQYDGVVPFDYNERKELESTVNTARDDKIQSIKNMITNLEIEQEDAQIQYKEKLEELDGWKSNIENQLTQKEEEIRQNDILISRKINQIDTLGEDIEFTDDKVDTLTEKEGVSDVNATKIEMEIKNMKREHLILKILLVVSIIIIVIILKKLFIK